MGNHAERHGLGRLFAQDTGFQIASDPDTVRAPDVASVARARLGEIPARAYAPLAPDLIAEVLSPGDRPGEVLEKMGDWLNAGVRLAWVLDPERREGRVYRGDGSMSLLRAHDSLEGEDVLPGFTLPLAELL